MKILLLSLFSFVFIIPSLGQWIGPDAANKMYYTKGFVGVGEIPAYKFHLKSTDNNPLFFAETNETSMSFTRHFIDLRAKSTFANTPYIAWHTPAGKRQAILGWENHAFSLALENGFNFSINGGKVGIGTADTKGYLLAVAGSAVAEEVVVKLKGNWPDYVLQPSYSITPLYSLSNYIKENGKLPEIPSAAEVRENGVNLNEMTALLLKKIEELTLYMIDAKLESDSLRARINKLEVFAKDESVQR